MHTKAIRIGSRVAAVMFCLPMLGAPARADCATRHFYNNSYPFKVTFGTAGGSCTGGTSQGRTCLIPANQTVELHYPGSFASGRSEMTIQSNEGGSYPIVPPTTFTISSDCFLARSESFQNFTVNSPAPGDVTTCGTLQFPCRSIGRP